MPLRRFSGAARGMDEDTPPASRAVTKPAAQQPSTLFDECKAVLQRLGLYRQSTLDDQHMDQSKAGSTRSKTSAAGLMSTTPQQAAAAAVPPTADAPPTAVPQSEQRTPQALSTTTATTTTTNGSSPAVLPALKPSPHGADYASARDQLPTPRRALGHTTSSMLPSWASSSTFPSDSGVPFPAAALTDSALPGPRRRTTATMIDDNVLHPGIAPAGRFSADGESVTSMGSWSNFFQLDALGLVGPHSSVAPGQQRQSVTPNNSFSTHTAVLNAAGSVQRSSSTMPGPALSAPHPPSRLALSNPDAPAPGAGQASSGRPGRHLEPLRAPQSGAQQDSGPAAMDIDGPSSPGNNGVAGHAAAQQPFAPAGSAECGLSSGAGSRKRGWARSLSGCDGAAVAGSEGDHAMMSGGAARTVPAAEASPPERWATPFRAPFGGFQTVGGGAEPTPASTASMLPRLALKSHTTGGAAGTGGRPSAGGVSCMPRTHSGLIPALVRPLEQPSKPRRSVPRLNLSTLSTLPELESPAASNGGAAKLPNLTPEEVGGIDSEEEEEVELQRWAKPPHWQPATEGRQWVYSPVSSEEVKAFEAVKAALPPHLVKEVEHLWRGMIEARYSCELMASRGVRVAKDITREWSEMSSHLVQRLETHEASAAEMQAYCEQQTTLVHQLTYQLRLAQAAAAAAATAGQRQVAYAQLGSAGSLGSHHASVQPHQQGGTSSGGKDTVARPPRRADRGGPQNERALPARISAPALSGAWLNELGGMLQQPSAAPAAPSQHQYAARAQTVGQLNWGAGPGGAPQQRLEPLLEQHQAAVLPGQSAISLPTTTYVAPSAQTCAHPSGGGGGGGSVHYNPMFAQQHQITENQQRLASLSVQQGKVRP